MKLLASISLTLFSASALSATLTWEPPTSRVDGTPLDPATEISEYRLTCGDTVTPIPATMTGQEYEVAKHEILPGYGTYDCFLTAVDTDGLVSMPSNAVILEWTKQPPSAPTNLLIIRE